MQTKPAIFFLTVFLTVLLFLPLIHPAFATTIFSDGFESGSFTGGGWTETITQGGSTISVVSSGSPHHGTYHAKATTTSTETAWCAVSKTLSATYSEIYMRVYVKFGNLPVDDNDIRSIIRLRNSLEQNVAVVYLKKISGVQTWCSDYRHLGGWLTGTSTTPTPEADVWFCIEIKWKSSTEGQSDGEQRVYIDGVEKITNINIDNDDRGSIRICDAGGDQIWNAGDYHYYDCVVVADTGPIGPETAAQEYSFTLSETAHATANLNIQQEHTYTFTGTIIQSSILSYSVEGIQEFIETLTQTVTSSGTTYYWMELSYSLTETAKPTATHSIGLEGIYTLIQTITPTETRIILQEQLYTLTQTTTLQTILTYAGELAEVFITNIETITPHEIITYWIESPIDWSIVAIGLAALAFVIAAAAIALK